MRTVRQMNPGHTAQSYIHLNVILRLDLPSTLICFPLLPVGPTFALLGFGYSDYI